jgi:hypothetical protein
MSKTCMAWTQNISRKAKVKKNWGKGQIGGKETVSILIALTSMPICNVLGFMGGCKEITCTWVKA